MGWGGRQTYGPLSPSATPIFDQVGAWCSAASTRYFNCLEWNGAQYAVSVPYFTEGPREHAPWKGVPIVIQRRTLGTFVGQMVTR